MKETASKTLRSIEIFSGAGGLAIATQKAGFSHQAVIEWNRDACDTLRENSARGDLAQTEGWNVIEGDIRDINARQYDGIDLLAGGPPCQPFSIGGKHQGQSDRRDMIPEFIRCVREARPRAFIMENVKGLTREAFRSYFSLTILQLAYPDVTAKPGESATSHLARLEDIHTKGKQPSLAYRVVYRLLNAADYGVAQTRERIFVVGFRADLNLSWHFPEATHSREALLREQWGSGTYWEEMGIGRPSRPAGIKPGHFDTTPDLLKENKLPWKTVRNAIQDLPEPQEQEHRKILNHRLQIGAKSYPGHTGSCIDWPAKTLKAGAHGVPGGENMLRYPDGKVRYFTIREAARLQTFPDQWKFKGAWSEAMRQLGNAVPVDLAGQVAASVAATLKNHE